ncbi:SH3 domain-containing protein [Naumannella sp. ID2617S]|nr:SH3 domain-containing protein [Naumannella sp. ID2617S]
MTVLRRFRTAAALAGAAALLSTGGVVAAIAHGKAAAADPFSVRANGGLNVRSGPGLNHPIIGNLPSGARIDSVGRAQNGWMPISFGGRTGWVSDLYLTAQGVGQSPANNAVPSGSAYTTAALNVRTGAGISYRVVTVLAKGARVQTTGVQTNGYAQIVLDGQVRWVSSQYLSGSAAPAPTPAGPGLPAVTGRATATAELMIRTTSGDVFQVIRDVPAGTVLQLTGVTENGRTQIVFEGAVRWVNSLYLSDSATVSRPVTGGLPAVRGQRYATTALILRSGSGDVFTSYGDAPAGARLDVTGVVENGRAQIVYNGAVRWVTAKYLSDTAPGPTGGGGGSSVSGQGGLSPNAQRVLAQLQGRFPQVRSYIGVRPDSLPDHPSGRAIDAMVYNDAATGQAIADYVRANAASLNVDYIIWNQRIWSVARSSEGWRYMADRGSNTANHRDHVHITVR